MKKKSKGRTILFLTVRSILFVLLAVYALLNVYGYRFDEVTQEIKKSGVIEIRAYPSHVNIFLDKQLQSDQSPYEIRDINIGTHDLVLEKKGFRPLEKMVKVEDIFVVRFGHLFLLPENILRSTQMILDAFDRRFTVGDSVYFLLQKQKTIFRYNMLSGEWHSYDIPFPETIESMLMRGDKRMVIQTKNNIYDVALPQFLVQKLSILRPVTFLQLDPTNTNNLLYVSDTTLYKYVLTSHTEEVLLQNVFSFVPTRSSLYYCSWDHKMYTIDNFSVRDPHPIPERSPLWSCPVVSVLETNNHRVVYTGNELFIDQVEIDKMVQSPPVLVQETSIMYVVGGSLYRYDMTTKRRDLINRFPTPIVSWTTGPDQDNLFLVSGSDLYFCDIKNSYCQQVFAGQKPIPWIFYHPDKKHLIVQYGQQVYRFDFSFWK